MNGIESRKLAGRLQIDARAEYLCLTQIAPLGLFSFDPQIATELLLSTRVA